MSNNEVELGASCEAVITESKRITPEKRDEVREIVLRISEPSFRFVEGQSIGVVVPGPHPFGNKHHMRRYTIAHANVSGRGESVDVSLLVRRCFYIDEVSGERYPGIASNFLCDAQPGQAINITGPYRSPFKVPADINSNLVMIGTGTGIAPFRAFIQHIYEQKGGWQGQVRLFYGAKSGMDLLYMNDQNDDLTNYYDEATFKAFNGIAGKPLVGEEKALQDSITENAKEVWGMMQEPNTYVFMAGLTKTSAATDKAMSEVAGSEEAWKAAKEKLVEQGRWSELLYS
ncbi:MAG: oxidoreductase [Chromatiales bacterium]|nr:oxidoreductase [Chromatiales bacterium]